MQRITGSGEDALYCIITFRSGADVMVAVFGGKCPRGGQSPTFGSRCPEGGRADRQRASVLIHANIQQLHTAVFVATRPAASTRVLV